MRVIFMGTPGFAATILENLIDAQNVMAVFTRADAVRGRGKSAMPSPVKQIAQRAGIPVYTPSTLRDPKVIRQIADMHPDVICVAAYGMILPKAVLDIPRHGCLNVHASLLPRWRGAAPVERAILAGDEYTGVCIMRVEEGLDTGDYCVSRRIEIGTKNTTQLTQELASIGSQALLTALNMIQKGKAEWKVQDDFFATYAEKIHKREFCITPEDKAADALLKIRASSPAHPSRCIIADREVTVLSAARVTSRLLREDMALEPGFMKLFQKKLYLACADMPIELLEVKPEGKKLMSGPAFAAGVQNAKSGTIRWEGLHV